MRKLPLPPLKYAFAGLLFLFLFGGEPTEFGKEKTFFHDYLIPKPVIQIGLGVNLNQITIKASAGMKVYEVKADYRLIAENADEALVKGNKEKLTEKYLIQVAQYREQEEAVRRAQRLRLQVDRKVSVDSTPEAGVAGLYKVQIGDFLTRDDALRYIVKLNRMGIQDTWIVRQEVTEKESKPLWILIDDELRSLRNSTVLYFIPSSPQSYLSYKGRDYRGIFILRASRRGIVLVNTLNLEDYLKAVVPSELSPYTFPQIEAHKAQAVAARTYAIKNLGQYRELGFDLVDTPRSQFYRGMNAEHPLSTAAVEETRGVVAKYKGRYIDALYTSTCGGATEDVENVFLGPALPYLRGTECVYEKQKHWPVSTETLLAPIYVHGRNVSPQIALLISLGVIEGAGDTVSFREAAGWDEVQSWLDRGRALLGKPDAQPEPGVTDVSIDSFLHSAVREFGWEDRVAHLLKESEQDFIFSGENGWPEKSRPLVAYFIQSGIFPSPESVGLHDRILTRGEAAHYLAQMLASYRDFCDAGIFEGIEGQELILRENGDSHTFRLAPAAYLLINNNGSHHSFVRDLDLLGGENLRWLSRDGEILYLEVSYPAYSNLLDRSSKYHSWSARLSREELSRRINRYYPIGELVDLVPLERAGSERVSRLLIRGSETDATVRGFRIRTVLGLRETLFVLDRERDPGGRVSHFLFTGKGWGHGVGLCQVGAFGMAQSGADFREILKKYYTGITIDEIY